ncbi:MAG: hypothetical protein ACLFSQ_12755 [Candidatus Zixiibacteriota bacterium]
MSYTGGTAGAAAAYQYMANATKASGAIVMVEPEEFIKIIGKIDKPIVIVAPPGFLSKKSKYLAHYKGFTFYTKSADDINISGTAEMIKAEKIWVPD